MKRALCLRCGADKDGAFAMCPACGHAPAAPGDMARHLLVSEFDFSEEQLAAARAVIGEGGQLEFAADALQTAEGALGKVRPDPHWLLFYALIVALPLVAALFYFLLAS